jgi:hypothetical protein
MSPAGERNRRRFVHSLATLDAQSMFDGGWLLALGQEDALRDVLGVYRELPAGQFETVAGEFQPTIRTLTRDNQTYVYAVNDSPWDVSVTMNVDMPPGCKMEKLGASSGVAAVARVGSEHTWQITLRPYDLAAARFWAPNVRIRNPVVSFSEEVRQGLERRIKDLSARVATLTTPRLLGALENSSFELPPQGEAIVGWTGRGELAGDVALDTTQKRGGGQSVKLTSRGRPVSLSSAPFKPPTTGRLSIELWLRTASADHLSVRLALDGQLGNGRFAPYGLIPAVGANAARVGEWVRYSFPVDDVPTEGLSDVSVRLELMSAGEVWVDDVQVFDLSFSEAERVELSKLIALTNLKLQHGQLADCTRLLESYWPQFLVANVPLAQAAGPLAQRPPTAPAAPAEPAKKPSMLDNLKGYLPKMPQF